MLKEREASLSALQQQVDAARALLEKEKERTEGKYLRHNSLGCFLVSWNLSFGFLFSTEEGGGG